MKYKIKYIILKENSQKHIWTYIIYVTFNFWTKKTTRNPTCLNSYTNTNKLSEMSLLYVRIYYLIDYVKIVGLLYKKLA